MHSSGGYDGACLLLLSPRGQFLSIAWRLSFHHSLSKAELEVNSSKRKDNDCCLEIGTHNAC